jgi:hypothetical protein
MKYFLTTLLFLLAAALSVCQAQQVRRLLLFAYSDKDTDLITQRNWLHADSLGVVERDIWIAVFTDPKTFRRMYEHHGATRDAFTLVLIGKDGTEKLRADKALPARELFDFIDAMPMRRAEMGSKNN